MQKKSAIKTRKRLDRIDFAIIISVLASIVMLYFIFCPRAEAQLKPAIEDYVNAIFKAEGGKKATYLYGIRSIPYETEEQARRYCYNTVFNTLVKYRSDRCSAGESDIDCLARRYCPLNVKNDPKGLNKHWKSNVLFYLRKGQE